MTLEKTLSISGKPGLYKLISQSKNGIIVESLLDKKRFPTGSIQNISSLGDIAIYTYTEEIPLKDVFLSIHKKESGKEALSHKSEKKQLLDYFREVLPEYDEDRVYASNFKKIIQWYNILVVSGFDFSNTEEEEDKKESTEKKSKKKVAKK